MTLDLREKIHHSSTFLPVGRSHQFCLSFLAGSRPQYRLQILTTIVFLFLKTQYLSPEPELGQRNHDFVTKEQGFK